MKINSEKIKKVHFIGIGGIGISAIARMMLDLGKIVSGSDGADSRVVKDLRNLGANIYIGHSEKALKKDVNLVVYTIAISKENPEFLKAKKLKIQTLSYPEMLGAVSEGFRTIAVSGTHGKTTTTAMLSGVLIDALLKPSVIVGSLLKGSGSNYIKGNGKFFLVEACEYKRSFLNLKPEILIINNIEEDHLDYYQNLADIQSAFRELAQSVPLGGFIVCKAKDKNLKPVLSGISSEKIVDYTEFIDEKLNLKVPGRHNLLNAAASLAVGSLLKIDKKKIKKSLLEYSGIWRRFEFKGKTAVGASVYDDYAHHPSEIEATLKGARGIFKGKIVVVFQPHLYSRTKRFLKEFGRSFRRADEVIVLPIYAARELEDSSINSKMLAEEINKNKVRAKYKENFDECSDYLSKHLKKGDFLMTIGAGDVFKIGESLLT
ncbi:UDP-N-acetylmuramate--L-alanine ligase [Candidatus Campbellbacteria bacterium CG11_big_fil_rev_8_21_14_0_20_44_21]|uniref:UDP-N-acetylmuramate--L-alanine ligase n=1 Tax=Candidatus Campbellbacteria bacterium CG22_combo_CG10-13_8_21_14_all_43_18 TaxID=1974530 RepID=A0A2H0DXH8_9BACT|nr:MAG: UDP-N-acetylmuramate--L-alanine ligase [Candidatus Campbellbacteria bacterium CG22_combo_CG10-13_8_21_14_all_43_18]PIR23997.1 MAG: UDP-N-acetylmuramate--L-alanine ligase [Candidatus Campbellbacteria bacterium CG11_big_fil_rev_8_21_14_0_20_44_21]